ncbi:MAG: energy transducer TonB, partial [Polyangiales bacterium]
MRSTARFFVFLSFALVLFGGTANAQDAVPPKVRSLPGIELPPDVELPESGLVRVLIRIDTDGKGSVEECEVAPALCSRVAEAIGRAEFVPAMRDGKPVASQISVDLRVRKPATGSPEEAGAPEATLEPESAEVHEELEFSATAEVDARLQVPISLELEGIRNIPGTFGEPFRILEVMPGTVPIANGQPYVYVRGAPPSGTVYLYDDIPVPLLFHSALGPATVHSGLIG